MVAIMRAKAADGCEWHSQMKERMQRASVYTKVRASKTNVIAGELPAEHER